MPRGYDSTQPKADWNPAASKLNFDTASVAKQAEAAFQTAMQNFWQYTVEAFDMAIGIDPSTFLPATQTQLGGFGTTTSILAQLITAGGGNASAPNLLTEYANTFNQAVSSGDWSNLLSSLYNETTSALSTIWPGAVPGLDASKITTGTLSSSLLPMIPQAQITGLETSLGALLPNSTWQTFINDVVGGTAGDVNSLVSWLNGVNTAATNAVTTGNYNGLLTALFGGTSVASTVIPSAVPGLDASKITSGAFAQSMITGLTTSLNSLLPTTTYQSLVDGISNALGHSGTNHTWTDVETYLGIIPGPNIGSAIPATVVPSLDASKITTGTFAQSMVSGLQSLWTSWFGTATPTGTSTLAAANVAALPATKITSGTFTTTLIPALDASKVTTGAFGTAQIPALPTSKITSGTFTNAFVPMIALIQARGSNLIPDPGFENAWGRGPAATAGVQSTDQAHSGTHSWKLTGNTTYVTYLNSSDTAGIIPIHTAPGEMFQLGIWVYPSASNTGTQVLRLDLNLSDSTGVHGATNVSTAWAPSSLTAGAWNYLTTTLTVPAGYDTFNPIFWMPSATAADVFYLDDALCREVTLVQATINALFSGGTVASTILPTAVPTLDASKIGTGTFAQSMVSGLTSLWNSWFGTPTPTGTSTLAAANVAPLPASQITSGTFGTAQIPALDASKITSGSLTGATVPGSQLTGSVLSSLLSGAVAIGLIPALPASQITSGAFGAAQIPSLDASKITTGAFAQAMITGLTDVWTNLFGASGTPSSSPILPAAVPALDASKIASGSLTGATVPGSQLTGSVASSLLSGAVALGLIPALPATQITSGTLSSASMIPSLDASKIATGTFAQSMVSGLTSLWTSWFGTATPTGTSTLAAANVAALPASKITTGTFTTALIPALDASKITSGSLTGATVPGSQLTGSVLSSLLSGAVALGLIPALPATQITSGTLSSASMVPALDASKITTGAFAQSMISGLSAIWTNLFGSSGTPSTSPIVPAVVPALDASKITSGSLTGATVPGSQLTGSVASSLLSGAVALGLIPALPATQITSGTLSSASMVPSLDASKIATGTFAQSMVSGLTSLWSSWFGTATPTGTSTLAAANVAPLPASQITSGTFGTGLIPSLDASKIVSGSLTGATVPGSQLTGSVLSSLLSGAVALGLIPALPATQITSGTLSSASMIPSLDASKVATGQFGSAQIPNISAGTGAGQSADLQTHLTNVAAQTGATGATAVAAAQSAMQTQANTLNALGAIVQAQQTQSTGNSQSGNNFQVYFGAYPAGPFSQAPFNVSTTGTGTGGLSLDGTKAVWNAVNNGDVQLVGIYNAGTTMTDYQRLDAQLAGYPNGGNAKNYAVLRSNAAGTTYVYGLVYLNSSFQLCWIVGCVISGTNYVWASGTNAPLNLAFTMLAGVGTNANRYQGISGNSVVFDHVNTASDPGGLFPVGATQRYWGFRSDTANNGQTTPAPAGYVGCADNLPPTIPGRGLRMYRTSTASVTVGNSAGLNVIPGTNFFDTIGETSPGISKMSTTIGNCYGVSYPCIQVTTGGRYIVSIRTDIYSASTGSGAVCLCAAIQRYNSAGILQETRLFPSGCFFVNGFGGQYNSGFVGGEQVIGCQDGDILQACYFINGGPVSASAGILNSLAFTGEATGNHTYFEVTAASRSFN